MTIFIGGGPTGETGDHGSLSGLADDDHEQYLLVDTEAGSRPTLFYGVAEPSSPVEGDIWIEDA